MNQRNHIQYGGASHPGKFSNQTKIKLIALLHTCGQPFTDTRDGKSYATATVGSQCWTACSVGGRMERACQFSGMYIGGWRKNENRGYCIPGIAQYGRYKLFGDVSPGRRGRISTIGHLREPHLYRQALVLNRRIVNKQLLQAFILYLHLSEQ